MRAEVEQKEEKSRKQQLIGRFVHGDVHHPNKDALIADLQSKHPYTPFSEESKEMIHLMVTHGMFRLVRYITQKSLFLSFEVLDRRDRPLYFVVHACFTQSSHEN